MFHTFSVLNAELMEEIVVINFINMRNIMLYLLPIS